VHDDGASAGEHVVERAPEGRRDDAERDGGRSRSAVGDCFLNADADQQSDGNGLCPNERERVETDLVGVRASDDGREQDRGNVVPVRDRGRLEAKEDVAHHAAAQTGDYSGQQDPATTTRPGAPIAIARSHRDRRTPWSGPRCGRLDLAQSAMITEGRERRNARIGSGCTSRLALDPSRRGNVMVPVRQLRDPGIYREGGRTYLLYSVAGEHGIGIAELEE
jgi:hypothetical protein